MVHLSPRSTNQESTDRSCSLGIYLPTGTGSRGINDSNPSRAHFEVQEMPLQHKRHLPRGSDQSFAAGRTRQRGSGSAPAL